MKNSGIPLSSLPPALRAQVLAEIDRGLTADPKNMTLNTPTTFAGLEKAALAKVRLRQSSKGPNKTEAAFTESLKSYFPGAVVHQHDITLTLANGLKYTPDNFVPLAEGATLHLKPAFYEVKGFMRDDAAAKLKMAARVHSWASFYLVTKNGRTSGGWDIQKILP